MLDFARNRSHFEACFLQRCFLESKFFCIVEVRLLVSEDFCDVLLLIIEVRSNNANCVLVNPHQAMYTQRMQAISIWEWSSGINVHWYFVHHWRSITTIKVLGFIPFDDVMSVAGGPQGNVCFFLPIEQTLVWSRTDSSTALSFTCSENLLRYTLRDSLNKIRRKGIVVPDVAVVYCLVNGGARYCTATQSQYSSWHPTCDHISNQYVWKNGAVRMEYR